MADMPDHLRGDGPCDGCGTHDNIVWFAESVLWNEVMSGSEPGSDPGGIFCIPCFIIRVDKAGLAPTGWRLIPDWHWETRTERSWRALLSLRPAEHAESKPKSPS